jgi:hypothetical protein
LPGFARDFAPNRTEFAETGYPAGSRVHVAQRVPRPLAAVTMAFPCAGPLRIQSAA